MKKKEEAGVNPAEIGLRIFLGFVLGSIPFSFLLGKALGKNLLKAGSHNPGATNLYRVCGPWVGLVGLGFDVGKGALAVQLGGGSAGLSLACGLISVLGHTFSPFLKFRGGKGVATAAGAFAVLSPMPTLFALGGFILILGSTRYVALASSFAALTLTISAWFLAYDTTIFLACLGISVLVLIRHRGNYQRIFQKKESKFRIHSEKQPD